MSSGSPQLEWMLLLMCIAIFQLRTMNMPTGKVEILNWRRFWVRSWQSNRTPSYHRLTAKQSLSNSSLLNGKKNARLFSNKSIYVTCQQERFFIFEGNCSNADDLFSTPEADTRLFLHVHDASLNYQDIIIHRPGTGVFILAIAVSVIEARIFFKTGKKNNLKLIDVEKIVNGIDYENIASVCEVLLGLHAFTGWDTTTAFYGCWKA